jgi:hypothetical protein
MELSPSVNAQAYVAFHRLHSWRTPGDAGFVTLDFIACLGKLANPSWLLVTALSAHCPEPAGTGHTIPFEFLLSRSLVETRGASMLFVDDQRQAKPRC